MKTINVLKIMKEEENERKKQRKNKTEEQSLLNKAYNFTETYIMPKINISEIIENDKKYDFMYDEIRTTSAEMVIMFSQVNKDNKAPNMLKDNEIDFINKSDIKLKKDIANRIKEYVIKKYTYENKVNDYIDKYIKPLLNELQKEKTIIYDTDSKDKDIMLITNNTMEFVKQYIYYETKESIGYSIFKYLYDEDYTNDWNFIFNDNENAKNEFAGIVKDFLKKYYNKIELKNISKLDIEQLLKNDSK